MRTTISAAWPPRSDLCFSAGGRAGVFSSAGGREQERMRGLCCVACARVSGGGRESGACAGTWCRVKGMQLINFQPPWLHCD